MNAEIAKLQSDFVQFSPLLPELNDIVIEFVRLLYEGRYTRKDILDIPFNVTCTFILNVDITILRSRTFMTKFTYKGEVDVIRSNFGYNFAINGTNGIIYNVSGRRLYFAYMLYLILGKNIISISL